MSRLNSFFSINNSEKHEQRNSGIELLRIICMLLIVSGHSITHGGYTDFPLSINGAFAIAATQGARIAVDCFVLITGYFAHGKTINYKKITRLYTQIFTYSVVISAFAYISGGELNVNKDRILQTFLPFSSSTYWFATCYLLLIIIAPVLQTFAENAEKRTYRVVLLLLTVVWCVLPTVHLGAPQYSNFVWFIYLYLLGAYLKKHPIPAADRFKTYHGFGCLALIVVLTVAVYYVGKNILFFRENAIYLFGQMNKVPALICAVILFFGFKNLRPINNRFIYRVAGCVFGVYLCHDNPFIRDFIWLKVFPIYKNINEVYFIPLLIFSILSVFVCGVIIELLRQRIMRFISGMRISNKIKSIIWKINHNRLNKANIKKLKRQDVSIISMNCTGGILYHDLGLQFLSPTINLFMRAGDFLKFCENMEYYFSIEKMTECRDKEIIGARTYPIAYLGDILLFLVHYHSVDEAEKKWNERKKRVNFDNLVIINTDREGTDNEIKDRFEKLPYRKVMFTHLPDEKHPSCFYIKGYEDEPSVGIITEHIGISGRRPIDQFDWVEFINGADI